MELRHTHTQARTYTHTHAHQFPKQITQSGAKWWAFFFWLLCHLSPQLSLPSLSRSSHILDTSRSNGHFRSSAADPDSRKAVCSITPSSHNLHFFLYRFIPPSTHILFSIKETYHFSSTPGRIVSVSFTFMWATLPTQLTPVLHEVW